MGKKKLRTHTGLYEYQLNAELLVPRRDFYRIDERISKETRSVEFKNGPSFMQHQFRSNVAKYVCSFMNSGENGTLLLGIDEEGIVTGYYATHYEVEDIKRDIEHAIKDVQPEIYSDQYSVKFVPVYNSSGVSPIRDLWVIEINISGSRNTTKEKLYECKQGVFIRGKDGGVEGPLNAQLIQEWTRRHFKVELEKLRRSSVTLRQELSSTQTNYNNKDMQLKAQEEELARREKAISSLEQNMMQNQAATDDLVTRNRQLQAENNALKASSDAIRHEISEIKHILVRQGQQKQSRSCVIS